jgi:hypothetical protein
MDALIACAEKIDEEEAARVLAARDGVLASKFMRKVLFGQ